MNLKTNNSSTCRVRPAINVLKSNSGCTKRNGNINGGRMLSTYRCAVRVSGMTTKGVWLSKDMTFQTITSCYVPVWHVIVRAGSLHCLGRLQARLRLSLRHSWKRDSLLKTIRPQSGQILIDRARRHTNRILRHTDVISKHYNGKRERKFRFPSHLPRVMLDSCLRATRWIVYNDKSGALTASLTIALSSRFTVVLDRLLQF